MANQKYTPVGSNVTRWKRLREVSILARWVWMALYTSKEAKDSPTGLFFGSTYSISNAAGVTPNEAHRGMQELVDARLVLWDMTHELVRLVELPDDLGRAHTEQAIHGWWGRFCNIPQCALRDSHVPQLAAMVMAGKVNDKMRDAWQSTFGTVDVPTKMPFLPSLSSSDTSTATQPSLFGDYRSVNSTFENQDSMKSGTAVLAPSYGSGTGSRSESSPSGSYSSSLSSSFAAPVESAHTGAVPGTAPPQRTAAVLVGPWEGSAKRAVVDSAGPSETTAENAAAEPNASTGETRRVWQEVAAEDGNASAEAPGPSRDLWSIHAHRTAAPPPPPPVPQPTTTVAITAVTRVPWSAPLAANPRAPASAAAIRIANATWLRGAHLHLQLKNEGIDETAHGWGVPFGEAWKRCVARTTEVLDAHGQDEAVTESRMFNAIDVRVAEARESRHLRYLIPIRLFEETSFGYAVALTPGLSVEKVAQRNNTSRGGIGPGLWAMCQEES